MCIGVPLQVVAADGEGFAVCAADGQRQRVDMRLVGDLPAGAWVLEYNGAARRTLTELEAQQTRAALAALRAALDPQGDPASIDALFADLVEREPQLPEHLRRGS